MVEEAMKKASKVRAEWQTEFSKNSGFKQNGYITQILAENFITLREQSWFPR